MPQCHYQRECGQPSPGGCCEDTHITPQTSRETHQWQQSCLKDRDRLFPPHLPPTSPSTWPSVRPSSRCAQESYGCPGGGTGGSSELQTLVSP